MLLLEPRFHSFSSIHETPQQGWDYCMSKAYCKYVILRSLAPAGPLTNYQTDGPPSSALS